NVAAAQSRGTAELIGPVPFAGKPVQRYAICRVFSSVPIPKFACPCSNLGCELLNHPNSTSALHPLLLAVHSLFHACRRPGVFTRDFTEGSASGFLFLQRTQ